VDNTHYSIAEAKNLLPSIVHKVEKGLPVTLTRRGKPIAVMLSVDAYQQLSLPKVGFWKALNAFQKSLAEETVGVTDADFQGLRDNTCGREVDLDR